MLRQYIFVDIFHSKQPTVEVMEILRHLHISTHMKTTVILTQNSIYQRYVLLLGYANRIMFYYITIVIWTNLNVF